VTLGIDPTTIDFDTAKKLDAVNEFIPSSSSNETPDRDASQATEFWHRLRSKIPTLLAESEIQAKLKTTTTTTTTTTANTTQRTTNHNNDNKCSDPSNK
jgi:hypothetical protein